jgi:hypothetical protein
MLWWAVLPAVLPVGWEKGGHVLVRSVCLDFHRERTWFLMESSGDPMKHLKEEEAKHLPSFWDFEEVKQWGLQLRGASGRRW